jgi:hypothetical protein
LKVKKNVVVRLIAFFSFVLLSPLLRELLCFFSLRVLGFILILPVIRQWFSRCTLPKESLILLQEGDITHFRGTEGEFRNTKRPLKGGRGCERCFLLESLPVIINTDGERSIDAKLKTMSREPGDHTVITFGQCLTLCKEIRGEVRAL